jgi:hypothetical protein
MGPASLRLAAIHLEKALDLIDLTSVGDEQNYVVVLFDQGVMVSHHDSIAAHNGIDRRSARQADFLDRSADNPRMSRIAVRYGLDRLGCATAQRMNLDHVASPNVRE